MDSSRGPDKSGERRSPRESGPAPAIGPPIDSLFEPIPSRAVRILRAKVGELEHIVRVHYDAAERADQDVTFDVNLAADIALVADILAEFIEWTTHDTEPPWSPWVGTEPFDPESSRSSPDVKGVHTVYATARRVIATWTDPLDDDKHGTAIAALADAIEARRPGERESHAD